MAEYLKEFSAAAAARAAGFKAKNASEAGNAVLRRPAVQQAIRAQVTARAETAKIDAQWVLERAREMFERCAGEVRPVLNRHGDPVLDPETGNPLYTLGQAANALKALELIGKHTGVAAFAERVEISGSDQVIETLIAARQRVAGSVRMREAELVQEQEALPKPALLEIERPRMGGNPPPPLRHAPQSPRPGGEFPTHGREGEAPNV
ncbi:MAG: terminase small subunit [Rhodospirillales bacterium]|nr:terminase small subunit [Rhodospirillales bacterium]MBN8925781.1 terminase small subunit [Rhodospirillales bacterium]